MVGLMQHFYEGNLHSREEISSFQPLTYQFEKRLSLRMNKLYTLILPRKGQSYTANSAPGFYTRFRRFGERLGGNRGISCKDTTKNPENKCDRALDADHISLGDGRDSSESDGIINFISQSSRFFDLLTFDDFDLPRLKSPRLDFSQKQSKRTD